MMQRRSFLASLAAIVCAPRWYCVPSHLISPVGIDMASGESWSMVGLNKYEERKQNG